MKLGGCTIFSLLYHAMRLAYNAIMEIAIYQYQKETNNKWAYNFIDHLIVDLETVIAIATIIKLDAYELHPQDEYKFNNFADES